MWRLVLAGVAAPAVVEDRELGEPGQEHDQILDALGVASADVGLGDVMTASCDPGPNALDVKLGTLEACVPDLDLETGFDGAPEEASNRPSPERRLEHEGLTILDRAFKETRTLVPSQAIGVGLAER